MGTINRENFILYLLNHLSATTDLYRINKIAFFVEFEFIYRTHKELSNTVFAAIDKGPVIDGYSEVLSAMAENGDIQIEKPYYIRPLKNSGELEVTEEEKELIDTLIEKYSELSTNDLIAISHSLDSYQITSNGESVMGNIIDKDLVHLDSYFDEDYVEELNDDTIEDEILQPVDFKNLVPYGTQQ